MKVMIADASAKQLADFAEKVLGIDGIDYRLGADKILAKMRVVQYDKDFIEIEEKPADIQRVDPPANQNNRRMATIIIGVQDTPGGSDPVPVAVNGKQYFVERAKPQVIPWEYWHALNNAKKLVYEQDAMGRIIDATKKEVHEYPVSLIHEDPEFAGWDMTEAERAAASKKAAAAAKAA